MKDREPASTQTVAAVWKVADESVLLRLKGCRRFSAVVDWWRIGSGRRLLPQALVFFFFLLFFCFVEEVTCCYALRQRALGGRLRPFSGDSDDVGFR
jgi:hypothetical protein